MVFCFLDISAHGIFYTITIMVNLGYEDTFSFAPSSSQKEMLSDDLSSIPCLRHRHSSELN